MIVNHLSRILGERRWSVQRLARESGLGYSTAHRLYSEKSARYDAATLDKICRALGVGVGDLLEYVPDDQGR